MICTANAGWRVASADIDDNVTFYPIVAWWERTDYPHGVCAIIVIEGELTVAKETDYIVGPGQGVERKNGAWKRKDKV